MFNKHIRIPSDKSARVPSIRELMQLPRLASHKEKVAVIALAVICAVTFVAAVAFASNLFKINAPARGGSFTEGLLGVPRYINPLLATTDTDKDIVALVYSGLLRSDGRGDYIPDLAEHWDVSDDGLTYTVKLKEDLRWHDGERVTSQDVAFTVRKAQDSAINSPRRANWEGVSVSAPSEREVVFTLKQPYAPFIENLTLGIMPEHIWKNVSSDEFGLYVANLKAVGTGPYRIERIEYDGSGLGRMMRLGSFGNFALGEPLIPKIVLKFFGPENELREAFARSEIDSMSGLSTEAAKESEKAGREVLSAPLPRVFAIFFNQNQSKALAKHSVREALLLSLGKRDLVTFALSGYGEPLTGPFIKKTDIPAADSEKAKELIVGEKEKLKITLVTADSPELARAATLIADTWKQLGIDVDVKVYEISDLNTNIIRPRKFDALLFGAVVGRTPDPYAFWHSSQRLDPGLNIAQYTNPTVDRALEDARRSYNEHVVEEQYEIFERELRADIPAIFLYAPHFTYLPPANVKSIDLEIVGNPADRYLNVYKWYILSDKVWKIFAP